LIVSGGWFSLISYYLLGCSIQFDLGTLAGGVHDLLSTLEEVMADDGAANSLSKLNLRFALLELTSPYNSFASGELKRCLFSIFVPLAKDAITE
jgi:hypothetical protein